MMSDYRRDFLQDNSTAFIGYIVVALGFLIVAFSYKNDLFLH